MGCSVIMIVLFTVLFILPMIFSIESMRVKQGIKWSTLKSTSYKYKIKLSARYWSRIFCHNLRQPKSIILDLYLKNQSQISQDFFNEFTNYLYNTQPKCINAISSHSYYLEDISIGNENWLWFLSESNNCFISNTSISISAPHVKSFFFNNPTIARVIIITLESINLLVKNEFNHWDDKQYIIVLIILKNDHPILENCIKNIYNVMRKISIDILEVLWKKHGVHNVFIGFPLLPFVNRRLWFYDPFYSNGIGHSPGNIVEIDPETPPIPKRLRDLQGYKLKIGLFEGKLTAQIRSTKTNSNKSYHHYLDIDDFYGMDGYLVQTISKYLNFTVDIVPPSKGVGYGYVENGTAIGTIGDVVYGRIHASFNSQYVKEYIDENQQSTVSMNIEFTVPVDWDRVCIIVPSSEEVPRWLRTFIYLHPAIWVFLLITIFIATIVWHLLRNQHHLASNIYQNYDKNYLAVFIDTFMLVVGAPLRKPNILGERILVGALALLGLTIMGAFTGTLYHSFTNDMFYRSIETLEELDTSGLLVATSSPNLENIFGLKNPNDKSSALSRLALKVIRTDIDNNDSPTIEKTAYNRSFASIYREKIFSIKKFHYLSEKGRSLVHLVPDCPQSYYLAYLMPANSIFLQSFNSIITALREAGIILFWNENTTWQSITSEIESMTNINIHHLDEPKPFSIQDMQTCFLILGLGHVIAFIVFIFEWIKNIISHNCRINIT